MQNADIGLIGLAVMGQNLVLNMNDKGFTVSVFNRTVSKVDAFLADEAKGTRIIGTHTLEEFINSLKRPRKIMLMVKAGEPVDEWIELLLPLLSPGDLIIDGGNSRYDDTTRRVKALDAKGILFLGTGVSGGEEGARHGPSMMPGGNPKGWPLIKEIFQKIAAKTPSGEPCCEWVGSDGAGHYVKMVHNGIEYGDMQLICEAYHMLKGAGIENLEMAKIYDQWNQGALNSYLIEITGKILATPEESGGYLVDSILDVAGQKGTGKWTAIHSLDQGIPLSLITEAVFARYLSSLKSERVAASKVLEGPKREGVIDGASREKLIEEVQAALYASKIISYAQGFMSMQRASTEFNWGLDFGAIALIWREGCIIRSQFLEKIKEAYKANPQLINLCLAPYFKNELTRCQDGWRNVVAMGAKWGIPLPCTGSALAFYDGYRSETLPANLLQAQRDYFGAHTYERVDAPRGEFFHSRWSELALSHKG